MSLLNDIITEKDGESKCPLRICFILGGLAIIGFTAYDITSGQHFLDHCGDWIKGVAEYIGLGGGAIGYKNSTEQSQ